MPTPDFSKIWGSESPLNPYTFSDSDYLQGWNFLGAVPPDRRMFDEWQKQTDQKTQWLFANGAYLIRRNSTEYEEGDIAFSSQLPSYMLLKCTTAGTTAATEPDMSGAITGGTITDGTVVWTYSEWQTYGSAFYVGLDGNLVPSDQFIYDANWAVGADGNLYPITSV